MEMRKSIAEDEITIALAGNPNSGKTSIFNQITGGKQHVGNWSGVIPNIFLLFLCISLLEDSGYMSRAAYVMDKIMQSFGLHGKSFIPLLIGFGCNVPGVMATRTLENKDDRTMDLFYCCLYICFGLDSCFYYLSGRIVARSGINRDEVKLVFNKE